MFKERSASLKPQKLELREPARNMNVNSGADKQTFFSFKGEIQNEPEHNVKANQSYCFPPKPPKNDFCKEK